MNTTLHRAAIRCLVIVAASGAAAVHAQTVTPPLTSFVNDPATNASDLQQQAGVRGAEDVQRARPRWWLPTDRSEAGSVPALQRDGGNRARLCREVQSVVGRSLGYTNRSDLLAAIQQTSGEELAAQGTLSTQVSAGQFANIGGRLTALRLGGASAAAHSRVAQARRRIVACSNCWRRDSISIRDCSWAAARLQTLRRRTRSRVAFGWFVESSYGFGDHDQTANEDAVRLRFGQRHDRDRLQLRVERPRRVRRLRPLHRRFRLGVAGERRRRRSRGHQRIVVRRVLRRRLDAQRHRDVWLAGVRRHASGRLCIEQCGLRVRVRRKSHTDGRSRRQLRGARCDGGIRVHGRRLGHRAFAERELPRRGHRRLR